MVFVDLDAKSGVAQNRREVVCPEATIREEND